MSYVQNPCAEPNSETPIPAAEIRSQDAYVALCGAKFTSGNQTMAALIEGLSQPQPTGNCAELATGTSMIGTDRYPLTPAQAMMAQAIADRAPKGTAVMVPISSEPGRVSLLKVISGGSINRSVLNPSNAPAPAAAPTGAEIAAAAGGTGPAVTGMKPSGADYPWGGVQAAMERLAPSCRWTDAAAASVAAKTPSSQPMSVWVGLLLAGVALYAAFGPKGAR